MPSKLALLPQNQKLQAQCTFPALKAQSLDRVYFLASVPWQTLTVILGDSLVSLSIDAKNQRPVSRRASERLRFTNELKCSRPLVPVTINIAEGVSFNSAGSDGWHGYLTLIITRKPRITNGTDSLTILLTRLALGLSNEGIGVPLQIIQDKSDDEMIQSEADARVKRQVESAEWSAEDVVAVLIKSHPVLRGTVEANRSSLAPRSSAMFTLSAVLRSTKILLDRLDLSDQNKAVEIATEFWTQLDQCFPDWAKCRKGLIRSSFLRENFVHTSAGVLAAIADATAANLNTLKQGSLKKVISGLVRIDWSRGAGMWSPGLTAGGRVSKETSEISKVSDYLMRVMTQTQGNR